MKKLLLIIIVLSISKFNAQTITPFVINSAGGGGLVGTTGYEVYYNIGEPCITTISSDSNIITQGFLQPDIIGKYGLTASAFVTPTSCIDNTDGSIVITANVTGLSTASYNIGYFWNLPTACPTGSNCSTVSNLPAGTYSVYVVYYLGSIAKDTVSINNLVVSGSAEPCQITFFNGLTPNGDGLNDVFFIQNIEQFKGNSVEIFNRWGQNLAYIKDYDNLNNNWKGTIGSSNEIAPSGTYFFIINLGNGTKSIKGWIELTSSK
jgi:gliding motility-associated-like protein